MKQMNILCATDNNFLLPTYVTMASVIKNIKDCHLSFYLIIDDDIPQESLDKLSDYIEETGNSLEFLTIKDRMFDKFVVSECFTPAAYFRLMAHKYLPQDMDRILYLDVDLIVNKDIYDFYSTDFNDKFLIATSHNPDPSYFNMLDSTIVNLEAAARGEFFNSGVIIFDLNKFREFITEDSYNKAYSKCENNGIKVFYDQGLLNYMFYDKTLYFSSMDYNYRYSIPKDYARRIKSNINYKKAIIHFTGMKQPYKPWDIIFTDSELKEYGNVPFQDGYFYVNKELNDLMKIWWDYAKQTPVYDQLVHDEKIKHKWFTRNLHKIFIKMNADKMKQSANNAKNPEVKEKIIYKTVNNGNYPQDFHYKIYKAVCVLLAPLLYVRKLFRRIKRGNKGNK